MKRISFWVVAAAISLAPPLFAQDAATEERLNQLNGKIENLIESQRAQQKQIEALLKEVEALREQAARPSGNYASAEDVKRLWDAIKDVDHKRAEDASKVSSEFTRLAKAVATTPPPKKTAPANSGNGSGGEKSADRGMGFPYTIKTGDTLSLIVAAYREKNIKVTTDQILKANPGLKPEKLTPGKEIWIPAPQ